MTIINFINLLESIFTTSFKHTARVLYGVSFETSTVSHIVERLNELNHNISNNINTGKHVGAKITVDDVTDAQQTLNTLILYYEKEHSIKSIPSRLKLHEMFRVIREIETPNIKGIAKDVVVEILKPSESGKKLTKKEQIAEAAKVKSEERKIEMIKKQGK